MQQGHRGTPSSPAAACRPSYWPPSTGDVAPMSWHRPRADLRRHRAQASAATISARSW